MATNEKRGKKNPANFLRFAEKRKEKKAFLSNTNQQPFVGNFYCPDRKIYLIVFAGLPVKDNKEEGETKERKREREGTRRSLEDDRKRRLVGGKRREDRSDPIRSDPIQREKAFALVRDFRHHHHHHHHHHRLGVTTTTTILHREKTRGQKGKKERKKKSRDDDEEEEYGLGGIRTIQQE